MIIYSCMTELSTFIYGQTLRYLYVHLSIATGVSGGHFEIPLTRPDYLTPMLNSLLTGSLFLGPVPTLREGL